MRLLASVTGRVVGLLHIQTLATIACGVMLLSSAAAQEAKISVSALTIKGHETAQRISTPKTSKIKSWNELVTEVRGRIANQPPESPGATLALLETVNRFWNSNIIFSSDSQHYGVADVWTTPFETLSEGSGDCEDLAIGKYFTLLRAGIPENRLRLQFSFFTPTSEAHITLAVQLNDGSVMIMDNLVTDVMPEQERKDLRLVFSINPERTDIRLPQYTHSITDMSIRFKDMYSRYTNQVSALLQAPVLALNQ